MGFISDLFRMSSGEPVHGRGVLTGLMRDKQRKDAQEAGVEYAEVEDAPTGNMFAAPDPNAAQQADDEARRLAWAQIAGYRR